MIAGVGLATDRLHALGIIDVRYCGYFRADYVKLVDP
jgi:hypothetical protein